MKFLARLLCISLLPVMVCIFVRTQSSELRASARADTGSPGALPAVPEHSAHRSVEFMVYYATLLTIRDLPQYLTDKAAAGFAVQQILIEKSAWGFLYPKDRFTHVPRPRGPMMTFEWQKLIDQRPQLAEGPLLDVFLYAAPDWSFLKNEKGWDPDSPPLVSVFLFSRDKIEGRDPEFAAHDLIPVVRRQFEMAVKKMPTHFYFTETLSPWDYDFDTKSIRFSGPPGVTRHNLMAPIFDPESKQGYRQQFDALPAKARAMMDYHMGTGGAGAVPYYNVIEHEIPGDVNPGSLGGGGYQPSRGWKESFAFARLPEPDIIALDRQVQITTIPIDPARAEQVHKQGGPLSARIYFVVDRIALQHPTKGDNETMVYARLEKVEILTRAKEVLASFKAESFPAPPVITASAAGGRSAGAAARRASTPKPNETNAERIRRLNQEQFDRIKAQRERVIACHAQARKASGTTNPNDPAYKRAYDACMKGH
jgi:hypothetical protein